MASTKLTIQFIPYSEIDGLKSGERIKKLLKIVLSDKIVVLQGKLKAEEEARLIEDTMAMIGHIKGFKGVELAVLNSKSPASMMGGVKSGIAKFLIGDRESLTVIGPANLIREIKKDPSKLEVMLKSRK
jgi:hypothetical protein